MMLLCSDSITERLERTRRLERDRLLRYSRALFLTFIIFFREFGVPFLFPFQFLVSLRFYVLFMIQSFLFLAFGHFLTLQSIRLQSTLKDIAILRSNRTKRLERVRLVVCTRSARQFFFSFFLIYSRHKKFLIDSGFVETRSWHKA